MTDDKCKKGEININKTKLLIDDTNIISRIEKLENKINEILRIVKYIEDYCEDRP